MARNNPLETSVELQDARNLSQVARDFGVKRKRDLKNHGGSFNNPVVGTDPEYFARRAGKVFNSAVKQDPELRRLYLKAWSLSNSIERVAVGFITDVPDLDAARELPEVVERIQEMVDAKDLRVVLSGRWLDRACDISSFAIEVITSPLVQQGKRVYGEDRGGLYAGLPPTLDLNTEEYWANVQAQLQSPVKVGQ